MTDRILFLDDNPARQRWAMTTIDATSSYFVSVTTAEEAIGFLRCTDPPFDRVYLDHDLGEESFVDSSRKDCGAEVVRWIVANRPAIGEITVHTMNTPAGHAMVRDLRRAGYNAR